MKKYGWFLHCSSNFWLIEMYILFILGTGNSPGIRVSCPKCKQHFCLDCDIYIHESLHNCPGCESFRRPKSATSDDWTDANFWWLNMFLWTECIPLTKSKLYYGHVNAVCSFGLKLLWVLYQVSCMSYDESEAHFVTVEVVFDVSTDSSTRGQVHGCGFFTLEPIVEIG